MSSPSALEEARRKEFRLNGFVVLRGFLPPDLVRAMHEQLLPLVLAEHERATRGESQALRSPGRLSLDLGHAIRVLGGPLGDERYARHPEIEDLVRSILGPDGTWKRGWTQVECAFLGSAFMSWHSDVPFDAAASDEAPRTTRLTYNIPLVDFTWANGTLEMLPGTQRLPRRFLADRFHDIQVYPVPLHLRVGDAILRDGNTLHRGTPNLTDAPRPMLDQTYKLVP